MLREEGSCSTKP